STKLIPFTTLPALTSRQGKILLDNITTFSLPVIARNLNCKGNWGRDDKKGQTNKEFCRNEG
ncbi:hypothetical protein MEO94_34060, partial [Dolichospermum sp. ST_sed9]|nr:hypothetical protein [Dolichospermum sp. ST_sed9]